MSTEMNSGNTLWCKSCSALKALQDFPTRVRKGKRGYSRCLACDTAASAAYRATNREAINLRRRNRTKSNPDFNRHANLRRVYGITLEQWNALFESQGRVCQICKTGEPRGRGWQTDHCHTTGAIRGILCHHCNAMLGYARDNTEILLASIKYLEAF